MPRTLGRKLMHRPSPLPLHVKVAKLWSLSVAFGRPRYAMWEPGWKEAATNPADSLSMAARELLQEALTQAFERRVARLAVLNPSSQG